MKLIILGVSGLLGHKLFQKLSKDFDVYGTLHKKKSEYNNLDFFSSSKIIENVNVLDFEELNFFLKKINPDIILNCVGITKRKINNDNISEVIQINSVFPHNLAKWGKNNNKKIIHFSTDCVFNGKKGLYSDNSVTNAEDLYGKSKALGELNYNNTLTIRSSFIGQELFDKTELLDWFISKNNEQIKGYNKVYYSGVSSNFMAKAVKEIILNYIDIFGIYNLAPTNPISKFELLKTAKNAFKLNIDIIKDEVIEHNPTLDGSKLLSITGIKPPSWETMMNELASDKDFYKF